MANKHESLSGLFSDIADAIRKKDGSTGKIIADDFPSAIENLEGGGSGGSGNLQSGTATPTGKTFTLKPDEGFDGFDSVTVEGDANLEPQNIAEGVTIYGVEGTLKIGAASSLPSEYEPYLEHAKLLYTGEYENIAVSENNEYLNIIFMTSGFKVVGYKSDTTQFSAQGWVLCRYQKSGQNWDVTDNRSTANEYGFNYVKNIRFSTIPWEYNGAVIWPMSSSGGGGTVAAAPGGTITLVGPDSPYVTFISTAFPAMGMTITEEV